MKVRISGRFKSPAATCPARRSSLSDFDEGECGVESQPGRVLAGNAVAPRKQVAKRGRHAADDGRFQIPTLTNAIANQFRWVHKGEPAAPGAAVTSTNHIYGASDPIATSAAVACALPNALAI